MDLYLKPHPVKDLILSGFLIGKSPPHQAKLLHLLCL